MKNKASKNKNKRYYGITIDELLAAPFVAAASANSAMAKKQTAFLLESCFSYNDSVDEDDNDVGIYSPKMITMTMTKNVIKPGKTKDGKIKMEQITTTFQIPHLTLIPFNSLCVKDLFVKFDMEIISQKRKKKADSNNDIANENVELIGAVSYDPNERREDQYQKKNNSKMSIEMNAGSIPLPVGFTTILDLYTKSINSTSLTNNKT